MPLVLYPRALHPEVKSAVCRKRDRPVNGNHAVYGRVVLTTYRVFIGEKQVGFVQSEGVFKNHALRWAAYRLSGQRVRVQEAARRKHAVSDLLYALTEDNDASPA